MPAPGSRRTLAPPRLPFADGFIGLDRGGVRVLNAAASRWPPLRAGVSLAARGLAGAQVVLMLALGLSGRPRAALRMLLAVGAVYGLVELLGRRWGRARPFARLDDVRPVAPHDPRRSFPSRHVASAVAMAAVALPARPRLGRVMGLLAGVLAATRVGAGLHYPSDVLAGALLGACVGRAFRDL